MREHFDVVYITKGPGWGNYFVHSAPWPHGFQLAQAFTRWGIERKARRLVRKGRAPRIYETLGEVR